MDLQRAVFPLFQVDKSHLEQQILPDLLEKDDLSFLIKVYYREFVLICAEPYFSKMLKVLKKGKNATFSQNIEGYITT